MAPTPSSSSPRPLGGKVLLSLLSLLLLAAPSVSFVSVNSPPSGRIRPSSSSFPIPTTTTTFVPGTSTTSLPAIGALAKKAKLALVSSWSSSNGSPELSSLLASMSDGTVPPQAPTLLQDSLTKRKGTLSVLAEYKRRSSHAGHISDDSTSMSPSLMSPLFREFGASAVAVLADERMGGCDYSDVQAFADEQRTARGNVPGPLPVVCSDLIVSDVQVARAKMAGADAVLLSLDVLGPRAVEELVGKAARVGLEAVVQASNEEEVRAAVELGALVVLVSSAGAGVDALREWRSLIPPGVTSVCTVYANDDKALSEVEDAWRLRDAGYHAVWANDCLYKSGNDPTEHAGAVIKAMKAKSSVKYASPRSKSGRGEGSREYLGDIMM
mmetsp:Transcript_11008/g.21928  ORF Transcript_11008/g.21928 Transcript_11008/m.21928 type:complete len:383 (+) Transcript_11008:203-1351(+)